MGPNEFSLSSSAAQLNHQLKVCESSLENEEGNEPSIVENNTLMPGNTFIIPIQPMASQQAIVAGSPGHKQNVSQL